VIAELGHYALMLALGLALIQGSMPIVGTRTDDQSLVSIAAPAALAQFAFVALSFAALATCYVTSDFSVLNVYENSNSAMPLMYRLTSVWGNHEGSMMLWVFILALFGALVAAFGGNLPVKLKANALAVQAWIAAAFQLFILSTSNPFLRIIDAPFEGRDLNPVLQDPGLAFHPPLSISAMLASRSPFRSPSRRCSKAASTPPGRAGCDRGCSAPGCASRSASPEVRTGPITSSAGAATGSGIRSKTPH
jgi:cytochrome c-type biogenesis protein CcmF